MKISTAPQFTLNKVPQNNKPQAPATPPKPDQVELNQGQQPEPSVSYGRVATLGAGLVGGAALGAAAGFHGGFLAEAIAVCSIPGLAVGGALLGGIAAEQFGPSSSEYRAIGGAMVGGLLGAGAGVTQSFMTATGGPVLAATLGVSAALMGGLMVFKALARPEQPPQ
ncbi:hypothetical protein JST97_02265 [bacterium]|nr:hypothetical protein [bacterium]